MLHKELRIQLMTGNSKHSSAMILILVCQQACSDESLLIQFSIPKQPRSPTEMRWLPSFSGLKVPLIIRWNFFLFNPHLRICVLFFNLFDRVGFVASYLPLTKPKAFWYTGRWYSNQPSHLSRAAKFFLSF